MLTAMKPITTGRIITCEAHCNQQKQLPINHLNNRTAPKLHGHVTSRLQRASFTTCCYSTIRLNTLKAQAHQEKGGTRFGAGRDDLAQTYKNYEKTFAEHNAALCKIVVDYEQQSAQVFTEYKHSSEQVVANFKKLLDKSSVEKLRSYNRLRTVYNQLNHRLDNAYQQACQQLSGEHERFKKQSWAHYDQSIGQLTAHQCAVGLREQLRAHYDQSFGQLIAHRNAVGQMVADYWQTRGRLRDERTRLRGLSMADSKKLSEELDKLQEEAQNREQRFLFAVYAINLFLELLRMASHSSQ